ncbi:MAG: 3-deoxy-manno-octulosonate-8-phosphatase KdsC [Gammaproteobacteria bacterium]|nr:MAG: 3-deoxy-manno-octulosonate-8-phosphatase KdsC [Gammaproteobacteria bacterium]
MKDVLERARKIRLAIFDVDGVLTDGSLFLSDDGKEYKAFYSRDGYGMNLLQEGGVEIAVITGRTSRVVAHRMENLRVRHVYQGHLEKLPVFYQLLEHLKLSPSQVAFVGDDIVDLPVMLKVGLAVAVQDAHPLVKHHAHWQTPNRGGRGAARDVCELILKAQGQWDAYVKRHLAQN